VVQRRRPLDYLGGPLPTIHDWTERKLIDFQRWGNRLSYAMPFNEYDPKLNHSGVKARKQDLAPVADVLDDAWRAGMSERAKRLFESLRSTREVLVG
jgi:hypothetical protein